MKDALGHNIHVGNFLLYPMRRGSSQWLCLGYVTSAHETAIRVHRIELGKTEESAHARLTVTTRAFTVPPDAVPTRIRKLLTPRD